MKVLQHHWCVVCPLLMGGTFSVSWAVYMDLLNNRFSIFIYCLRLRKTASVTLTGLFLRVPLISEDPRICRDLSLPDAWVILSESDHGMFLIFFIKLEDNKGRKVTDADFWRKISIVSKLWKCLENSQKSNFSNFNENVSHCVLFGPPTSVGGGP